VGHYLDQHIGNLREGGYLIRCQGAGEHNSVGAQVAVECDIGLVHDSAADAGGDTEPRVPAAELSQKARIVYDDPIDPPPEQFLDLFHQVSPSSSPGDDIESNLHGSALRMGRHQDILKRLGGQFAPGSAAAKAFETDIDGIGAGLQRRPSHRQATRRRQQDGLGGAIGGRL
jgi:hypothetical protein